MAALPASNRKNKKNVTDLLITHVKALSEKTGLSLDLTNLNKTSKTKKVYEKHQMEQLNNDFQFNELSEFVINNMNENCVISSTERSNYNLLLKSGVIDLAPEKFDIDDDKLDEYHNYSHMSIEDLKKVILQKKTQLNLSKKSYSQIKKQKKFLEKHNHHLNNQNKHINALNDENTETNIDQGIDFSDFKVNLENYKNDLVSKSELILQPITNAFKFLTCYNKVDVSLINSMKMDEMLNSTLKIDDSVVQNYGGIFKVYSELNNRMNQFLNFFLQNHIPTTFDKYGADKALTKVYLVESTKAAKYTCQFLSDYDEIVYPYFFNF